MLLKKDLIRALTVTVNSLTVTVNLTALQLGFFVVPGTNRVRPKILGKMRASFFYEIRDYLGSLN
jgi:hypothetical protein